MYLIYSVKRLRDDHFQSSGKSKQKQAEQAEKEELKCYVKSLIFRENNEDKFITEEMIVKISWNWSRVNGKIANRQGTERKFSTVKWYKEWESNENEMIKKFREIEAKINWKSPRNVAKANIPWK